MAQRYACAWAYFSIILCTDIVYQLGFPSFQTISSLSIFLRDSQQAMRPSGMVQMLSNDALTMTLESESVPIPFLLVQITAVSLNSSFPPKIRFCVRAGPNQGCTACRRSRSIEWYYFQSRLSVRKWRTSRKSSSFSEEFKTYLTWRFALLIVLSSTLNSASMDVPMIKTVGQNISHTYPHLPDQTPIGPHLDESFLARGSAISLTLIDAELNSESNSTC